MKHMTMYEMMFAIGIGIVVFLHFSCFSKKICIKKPFISKFLVAIVSVGLFFIGGANTHACILAFTCFLFGYLWLYVYHKFILEQDSEVNLLTKSNDKEKLK